MRKYLSEGHARNETHDALADAQGEGAAGLEHRDTHGGPASPPLAETIAAMRYQHRLRNYHQEQRKRSDLSLGWFLKTQLGWSKTLPDAERKTIAQRAADLIEIGEAEFEAMQLGARTDLTKAEQHRYQKALRACETDEPAYREWRRTIIATVASRKPHDDIEQETTEEMERLAKLLPCWKWAEAIRGLGALSLATIIGETGDIANYPTVAKLWKRMCLAVIDGRRQGNPQAGGSKEDTKALWIKHGYVKVRRSRMWNIGDRLIKLNQDGPYRTCYLARKKYLIERAKGRGLTVVPSAKIPKIGKENFISDGHIHRDAQRYMEKRLLRDLWRIWRDHSSVEAQNAIVPPRPQTIPHLTTTGAVSAAENSTRG